MSWDSVFVLPIVAAAIALFYPLSINGMYSLRLVNSSLVRVILLRRTTIATLLMSTLIALAVPVYSMSNIEMGLLLCAVVLLPLYLIHVYLRITNGALGWSSNQVVESDLISNGKEFSEVSKIRPNLAHSSTGTERIKRKVARSTKGNSLASIVATLEAA